ncbi:SET domain-containing protein SmydA-8 isoform X2 [Folsomia candida]|uniref:SET domain-containing protein SmydA-8 isoform X2 n=1 Tax=Folsomia candida TaxID=158441 RepID=UPI0016055E9A|nr:SET domain-containing protein SmydA-8 isoform X2 [Folsomia candida]
MGHPLGSICNLSTKLKLDMTILKSQCGSPHSLYMVLEHLKWMDAKINIPFHSRNECAVFSSAGITPPLQPPYDFIHPAELIKVLRAVLISKGRTAEDAATWGAMTKLESHMKQREAIPKVRFMSTLTKNFIRGACHVGDVPEEQIDLILGIIDVNAFRHTLHPNNPLRMEAVKANKDVDKNATFLYPKGSMAAHGCRRTVRWETLPSGTLEMYVTEDTPALSLLTHPYVDLMKGTPERRRLLRDQFYFDCSCPRCSDRTELGTHFSTLKCPTCFEGNLLPDYPLHYKSPWTCASCHATKPSHFERNVVRGMQAEMKSVLEQCSGNNLAVVAGLAKLLGKYRGKICHPNHFAVVDVEYHLVRRMALMRKPTVDLLLEMKKLIHKYLDIAVVFYPGIK